jgi:ERCC4-type nuclease
MTSPNTIIADLLAELEELRAKVANTKRPLETATNITHMERLAQTKEELEYWSRKYADSVSAYDNADFFSYPSVDQIEKEMEENRAALVEWAIEFNNAWEVV